MAACIWITCGPSIILSSSIVCYPQLSVGAGVQLHGNVQSRCLDEQRKLRYERCPESPPTILPQRSWQNQVVTKRAGDQSATWGLTSTYSTQSLCISWDIPGHSLSSQRLSKTDGQLTAAKFHLANTNAVAHVAARCTRCIHTRCIHT